MDHKDDNKQVIQDDGSHATHTGNMVGTSNVLVYASRRGSMAKRETMVSVTEAVHQWFVQVVNKGAVKGGRANGASILVDILEAVGGDKLVCFQHNTPELTLRRKTRTVEGRTRSRASIFQHGIQENGKFATSSKCNRFA